MAKRSRRKQLQSLRVDLRAGVMLVRAFGPYLVRALFESIAARRRRRSIKIGAFAVGGAAAGLAAVRIATHRPPTGDDTAWALSGALFWGLFGASSLILGGAIALVFHVRERILGLIMAFGAGVLISAVAYDLVADAFESSAGNGSLALGLAAGALTFFAGDAVIDSMGGDKRKSMAPATGPGTGSALAIVLGIVLDGIPESAVIGLGLLSGEGVSVAVIAAVFLSNLPEAIAATTGLSRGGWASRNIMGLWVLVTAVSGLASLLGYALFDSAGASAHAFVLAFAAGAILTMLADTMMPEAFEHGGKLVGLLTTLGFGLAFAIAMLE